MSEVFHLGLTKEMLEGAEYAIVPGDPARSERIARAMDNPKFLNATREYTSYLGYINQKAVVVCSTGIGGPSVSICVEELAQLGIRNFIRIGTTGAIQPHINIGDIIITTGAVRLDGASLHFAPLCFPAVADFHLTAALLGASQQQGYPSHIGITASSDTFYPGQERYDTYSGKVRKEYRGMLKEWQDLGVMNFEMESATLYTMCSALGLKAAMVSGVIVNRTQQEIPNEEDAKVVEIRSITTAIEALKTLIG